MGTIRDAFTSSKTHQLSSKRIAGAVCIVFSMSIVLLSYFMSVEGKDKVKDVPENVKIVSLQFLLTGGSLLGLGLLEKKES